MSATTPTLTDRLKPTLDEYWKYWNLGQYDYFKQSRKVGKAALSPWTHTEKMAEREELETVINPGSGGRMVPTGLYTRLLIFQKSHRHPDYPHNKLEWETVMSDTPDEMNDHEDVILNATGRVLIHGLGLGCVLNCLLYKPDVTHIDVVEINLDVLELIMPFYKAHRKVTFHHDSCVEKKWPKGTRWNYVWHDIWSTISSANLRNSDEYDPEHGISYEKLHRMFGHRCDRQGAWGFQDSKWMRKVEAFEEEYAVQFAIVWNMLDHEGRLDLLLDIVTPGVTDKKVWLAFLQWEQNTSGNQMLEQYKEACKHKINELEARHIMGDKLKHYAQSKVKR